MEDSDARFTQESLDTCVRLFSGMKESKPSSLNEKNTTNKYMNIGGWQKISLMDYPDLVSTVVFTNGCVFRCGFCHNPGLVVPPFRGKVEESELFSYLEQRKDVIHGVVITGGEPTIHADLPDFIRRIRALGYRVKLDTCGWFPDRVKYLIANELLDYIAMDIKAPLEKYAEIVGVPADPSRITESIRIIMRSGVSYEFRSTLVQSIHALEDIVRMAELIRGAKRYYLQQFRAAKTMVNQSYQTRSAPSIDELQQAVEACKCVVEDCRIRE